MFEMSPRSTKRNKKSAKNIPNIGLLSGSAVSLTLLHNDLSDWWPLQALSSWPSLSMKALIFSTHIRDALFDIGRIRTLCNNRVCAVHCPQRFWRESKFVHPQKYKMPHGRKNFKKKKELVLIFFFCTCCYIYTSFFLSFILLATFIITASW